MNYYININLFNKRISKEIKAYLKKYFSDMLFVVFLLIIVAQQYGKPELDVNDYHFTSEQKWEVIGEKFYGKKNYYIIKNSNGIRYLLDEKKFNSNINYGDVFISDIRLKPFKKAGLKGEYNELKYFYSQGIFAKAEASNIRKIKNSSEWKMLPKIIRTSISGCIEKYPEESGKFLNRMILGNSYANSLRYYKNGKQQDIFNGEQCYFKNGKQQDIVNGEQCYYENSKQDDIVENMRDLGISHLLAVSGLHINFIYSFLIFILSFIPISRGKTDLLCIGILLFYAWILDFSASVVRVVLFIAIRQLSVHFRFKVLRRRRILFCLGLILLFQPFRIYDLGFRLSFLASMAIDFSGYLQKLKPISNKWIKNIRLTFWINIFTLPFIADSMGEISAAVFLGNLLILPIYSLLFITGTLSILFQFVPGINTVAREIFSLSYNLFSYLIKGLTILPFPKRKIIGGIAESEIIIYYLLISAVCLTVSKRSISNIIFTRSTLISGRELYKQKVIYFKMTIITILFIYFNSFFVPIVPTLTMLDIGQGDSFLFSHNGINFLFDTGGEIKIGDKRIGIGDKGTGKKNEKTEQGDLLAKELLRRGVGKLDAVFISHRDYDHVGNLKKLSEYIEISKIYCSYKKDGTVPADYFDESLKEKITCLDTGDEISLDSGSVSIKVVDAGRYDEEDANSKSMILILDYGLKVLFTGDRKISDFPDLKAVGDVDILKIAHHGSKNGTDQGILDSVTPEIALISCGMENMYGHPHESVIEVLEKNSIDIYRTDFDGVVELKFFKSIFGGQYLSIKTAY